MSNSFAGFGMNAAGGAVGLPGNPGPSILDFMQIGFGSGSGGGSNGAGAPTDGGAGGLSCGGGGGGAGNAAGNGGPGGSAFLLLGWI